MKDEDDPGADLGIEEEDLEDEGRELKRAWQSHPWTGRMRKSAVTARKEALEALKHAARRSPDPGVSAAIAMYDCIRQLEVSMATGEIPDDVGGFFGGST
jgi:hypothetical protein